MKTDGFWSTYKWWIVAVVALLIVVAVVTYFASRQPEQVAVTPPATAPAPSAITPMFSVVDYGAKGDGMTNDEEAILKAVAAANGAIVFFPAGNYLVGELFKMPPDVLAKGAVDPASFLMVVTPEGDVMWRWIRP